MDFRSHRHGSRFVRVIAACLLCAAALAQAFTPRTSAQADESVTTIYFQACPQSFNAITFAEYDLGCREEGFIHDLYWYFQEADGSRGSRPAQPTDLPYRTTVSYSTFNEGLLETGLDTPKVSVAMVAFCKTTKPDGSVLVDDRPRIAGTTIAGQSAVLGYTTVCYVFINPDTSVDPTGGTTASVTVHTCADDFTGSGFYQYKVNCNGQKATASNPFALTVNGIESVQYSQVSADGINQPMIFTYPDYFDGNPPVTIHQVHNESVKDPVAFCSQSTHQGLPVLDGEEVPIDAATKTLQLSATYGDTVICDWYQFPGGVTAADAAGTNNAVADDGNNQLQADDGAATPEIGGDQPQAENDGTAADETGSQPPAENGGAIEPRDNDTGDANQNGVAQPIPNSSSAGNQNGSGGNQPPANTTAGSNQTGAVPASGGGSGGGTSAQQDNAGGMNAPAVASPGATTGAANFSLDVLDCAGQDLRERNSYLSDKEFLQALLNACVYTQVPFVFTIDTLAPLTISGRPWSGVDLSLDSGDHTIRMDPVAGYSSSELLCYPSEFDDSVGPNPVVWIPVENGTATVTTVAGESTTCSWFNMGAGSGG
jgi:hypothetical protein